MAFPLNPGDGQFPLGTLPAIVLVGPSTNIMANTVATAWGSANRCVFIAFTVGRPVTVSTAWFRVQTSSGNMSIGILDASGNRLATTGAFAVPAQATTCSQALTGSITLTPGNVYYAVMSCDNTTAIFLSYGVSPHPAVTSYTAIGIAASSHPIPTSVSIAEGAPGVVPYIAFT